MAFVYWIHLPSHTDIKTEGYVGFTSKTVKHRIKVHKALAISKNSRDYPIYNAIRKYGDELLVKTLVEGDIDYCLEIEYKLRPSTKIGWNIAVGGDKPMYGLHHSKETREKLRACGILNREIHRARALAVPIWEHGSSDPLVWASAEEVFDCYLAHNCEIGPVLLARAFGQGNKKLEAMLIRFKDGWNPHKCVEWKKWRESYPSRLQGWKKGDPLIERKRPEVTPELSAARAIGGKTRVWTKEMRENLSKKKKGRKMSEDFCKNLSRVKTGSRISEEAREKLKAKLTDNPWLNSTANKALWADAAKIRDSLYSGKTQADLLRHYGFDRKSGALTKIVRKIKNGWIPVEDSNWVAYFNKENK